MHSRFYILVFNLTLLGTACTTTGAEPERFANLDCKALSELSKSYTNSLSHLDIFNDTDINELERTGRRDRIIGQSRDNLRPYEKGREKDINSIRAASRLKKC